MPSKSETDKNIERLDIQCDTVEQYIAAKRKVSVGQVNALIESCRRLIESYYKEL